MNGECLFFAAMSGLAVMSCTSSLSFAVIYDLPMFVSENRNHRTMLSLLSVVLLMLLIILGFLYVLTINQNMRLFVLYCPEANILMLIGVAGNFCC